MFWYALIACGLLAIACLALARYQRAVTPSGHIVNGITAMVTGVFGLVMLAAAVFTALGWDG